MTQNDQSSSGDMRPLARLPATASVAPKGQRALGMAAPRDGLLYVPAGYQAHVPAPLVVVLHGAGGTAQGGLAPLLPLADAAGLILLAPESRGRTWDALTGTFGPDIAFLDQALTQVFIRYAVDRARIAIAGFSDGASYALSVGNYNGDLFTHVIAFSPGFMRLPRETVCPPAFISHGVDDAMLPIDVCSRRIVAQLEEAGCSVRYREFAGGHIVPPEIAREAVAWFSGMPPETNA